MVTVIMRMRMRMRMRRRRKRKIYFQPPASGAGGGPTKLKRTLGKHIHLYKGAREETTRSRHPTTNIKTVCCQRPAFCMSPKMRLHGARAIPQARVAASLLPHWHPSSGVGLVAPSLAPSFISLVSLASSAFCSVASSAASFIRPADAPTSGVEGRKARLMARVR